MYLVCSTGLFRELLYILMFLNNVIVSIFVLVLVVHVTLLPYSTDSSCAWWEGWYKRASNIFNAVSAFSKSNHG